MDYAAAAHEIIDGAYRATSGDGFNPDNIFAQYSNAGMPLGSIQETALVYFQPHALGTLVVRRDAATKDNIKLFPPGLDGRSMLAAYLENIDPKG